MDGLPLTEQGTHDHASRNPGAMHACGHDGHMAMVLDDGLLDRFPVDALFGLHNLPGVPVGHFHTRTGAIMASEDNVEIRITGRGGHAARPQMVVDPLVAGAEVVLALQTVVARNVDPALPAVLMHRLPHRRPRRRGRRLRPARPIGAR